MSRPRPWDGGPLHPTQWHNDSDMTNTCPEGYPVAPFGVAHLKGATRRDYFAAHAPAVPHWFRVTHADPMPPIWQFSAWLTRRRDQAAVREFAWRRHFADSLLRELA